MKEEDKVLLLKDLSARLPYGVIIHLVEPNEDEELYCLNIPQEGLYTRSLEHNNVTTLCPIEDIKPYLRPMSSMTEEERKEFPFPYYFEWINSDFNLLCSNDKVCASIGFDEMYKIMDWLNAHHFDYRGLIEKGLALEAPEGIYNIK